MNKTKKYLFYHVLLFLLFCIIGVLVYLFDFSFPCVTFEATGIYCPTCGVTRAVKLLAEFKPIMSFVSNPLPLLIVVWLSLAIAFYAYCLATKTQKNYNYIVPTVIVCVCVLGCFVAKNILNILI